MSDDDKRLQIVTSFILDSPPGEINDVFNDVRVLLDDDALLQDRIPGAFAEYNTEQYVTTVVPGLDHQVAVDPQPAETQSSNEELRSAINDAMDKYVSDHYSAGVVTVYENATDGTITILIVNSKFNPNNFWNGRWRSTWTVNPSTGHLKGTAKVHVHYYEDGNVQLNSSKEFVGSVSGGSG
ncbi:F-actin-capping protein, partial [Quaeritorhiza haematococci]